MVSRELNKGTSLDSYIPDKVRQAGRLLEDNYAFNYMETYQSFSLTDGMRSFALPARFKSMIFFRLAYDDEDDYRYLKKVDPRQVTKVSTDPEDRPIAWWLSGGDSAWLDAEISTTATGIDAEIFYKRYSSWPTSPYASTPDILERGEVALMAQTMVLFGPFIRNPELHQQWKDILADALRILTGSDMNQEQGGANPAMGYR